jgi:hypothetical protein
MDDSILKKKRRTFRWPAMARELVEANLKATGFQLRQLVTQLLEMTGYPRSACRRFMQRMGNKAKSPYKRWPASEQERLLELLDKHSIADASRRMRCSKRAVYSVLRRLKTSASMRQDAFSKSRLAAVLHTHIYEIDSWIRNGWLKATIIQVGQVSRTVIRPDDFVQFCLEHGEVVVGNRLNLERLEFVYKYVFPPDHNYLLAVRQSKKERASLADSPPVSAQHGESETVVWEPEDGDSSTTIYDASALLRRENQTGR